MPETSILIIVLALLMQCSVAGMTDAEELEFLGLWLIDIGKSMRDLSAAVQQCYERLFRETEPADDNSLDRESGNLREVVIAPFRPDPLLL